jgi:hypothetical protein
MSFGDNDVVSGAIDDQGLVEQRRAEWRLCHLAGQRDGVPVAAMIAKSPASKVQSRGSPATTGCTCGSTTVIETPECVCQPTEVTGPAASGLAGGVTSGPTLERVPKYHVCVVAGCPVVSCEERMLRYH